MSRCTKVLLAICGGPAASRLPELVHQLRRRGCAIRSLLTREAEPWVAGRALADLGGEPLVAPEDGIEELMAWADAVCLAPFPAESLPFLGHCLSPRREPLEVEIPALGDPRLGPLLCAFDGPRVLAVEAEHWDEGAVQTAASFLARHRVEVVAPHRGALAEPEAVAERLVAQPVELDLAGRRFLVSAGPTYEPIDPVRFLGNRSSGKMGFALAAEVARHGAHTTLVAGPVSLDTPPGVERIDVATALEMYDAVHAHLALADCVVMTAAVADFRAEVSESRKIKKERGVPRIELIPNPDILASLAEAAPQALRVGFAAETELCADEAWSKLERKKAHLLVWNDVSQRGIGFGADDNEVTVYRQGCEPRVVSRRPKREIASVLVDIFVDTLIHREAETFASVV